MHNIFLASLLSWDNQEMTVFKIAFSHLQFLKKQPFFSSKELSTANTERAHSSQGAICQLQLGLLYNALPAGAQYGLGYPMLQFP